MRRRELLGGAAGVLELSQTSFTPNAAAQTLTATATYGNNPIIDMDSSMFTSTGDLIDTISVSSGSNAISINIKANTNTSSGRSGVVQFAYKGQIVSIDITQSKDEIVNTVEQSTTYRNYIIDVDAPFIYNAYGSPSKNNVYVKVSWRYKYMLRYYNVNYYASGRTASGGTTRYSDWINATNQDWKKLPASMIQNWTTGFIKPSAFNEGFKILSYNQSAYTASINYNFTTVGSSPYEGNVEGPAGDVDIHYYFM